MPNKPSNPTSWKKFFEGIDKELEKICKVYWTMTHGKTHRVSWVFKNKKWGLGPLLPKSTAQKASYISCIHRIPQRSRFWKKLYERLGDGGRVLVITQGCQGTLPIPPRIASSFPDCPSIETLIQEMQKSGLSALCPKVHIVKRTIAKPVWRKWLLEGCFTDMDYCDRLEIEDYCEGLPENVEVLMAYYIVVGIKLGPQNGLIHIRPSKTHGLSACARTRLEPN